MNKKSLEALLATEDLGEMMALVERCSSHAKDNESITPQQMQQLIERTELLTVELQRLTQSPL